MSKWKAGVSRRRFLSHFLPSDISRPSPGTNNRELNTRVAINIIYIFSHVLFAVSNCVFPWRDSSPNHGDRNL